jgi:threonylcarbamoyladenosine tRNA methylthiotransferase MtaB
MKVSVLTLGCKVNQSESYDIESSLIKHGLSLVSLSEQPDYCIINSCTVTAKSDYQSRQLIRRTLRSGAKVIVTGCYAQLRPQEIRNIDDQISIVDNHDKSNIINLIPHNSECSTSYYFKRSRAYLKVQDGCNSSCAYCVVPQARGRSRSITTSEVIRKADELEKTGYKEIVLTGIHLGLYGHDLFPKTNLTELLKFILKKTKIPRIRLSSLEVNEINDEIIEVLQDNRLCSHVHVPLQSGDDQILRLMKRSYNVSKFLTKIDNITKKIENVAIGTDVIVGFPGEGQKEFNNTKHTLNSIPLAYMHIFSYSKRPHTEASKMDNLNNKHIIHERYVQLNDLHNIKKMDYMTSCINKNLDIIIEERGSENTVVGTSSNYLKIIVPSITYNKGSLIRVRVVSICNDKLLAHPVQNL